MVLAHYCVWRLEASRPYPVQITRRLEHPAIATPAAKAASVGPAKAGTTRFHFGIAQPRPNLFFEFGFAIPGVLGTLFGVFGGNRAIPGRNGTRVVVVAVLVTLVEIAVKVVVVDVVLAKVAIAGLVDEVAVFAVEVLSSTLVV